jgi:hypothetical protein
MPHIHAHDGGLLVLRACNQSTAGISLVNLAEPDCGEKQNQGTSDKAKHQPDKEEHGIPSS